MYNKSTDLGYDVPAEARLHARWSELCESRKYRDETLGDDFPTIAEFYKGRNVFITGASGFLGKIIVEKLLWGCPEIGNVYVLLRPRRGQNITSRMSDILNLPIFDRLRTKRPKDLQKVVAVRGDCSEEGLGLSDNDRKTLVNEVSVVIHSAASVRFNDPVKKAVLLNTGSTCEIANLAREMKQLKVLVHVSTAYCFTNHQPTLERVYPTDFHWRDVLQYAKLPDANALDLLGHKFTGFQPNSYLFSKALSENVMEEASQDIPVVIVRPSIVTCAVAEPIRGWMDNLNGFAMFWAFFCKGLMRACYCGRGGVAKFDLVPVDVVSNATIAASWTKGIGQALSLEQPQRLKYRRINDRLRNLAESYEEYKNEGRRISYMRACGLSVAITCFGWSGFLKTGSSYPFEDHLTTQNRKNGGHADVVNVAYGDFQPTSLLAMKRFLKLSLKNRNLACSGVVRYPYFILSNNKYLCFVIKFFWEQVFGFFGDLMLTLTGRKPRLMPLYRKVEFAYTSLRYFLDNDFIFDASNFWRLNAMLHPSERKEYEPRLLRINENDIQVYTDQLGGVCLYALKEPARGPADILKDSYHISRLFWAEVFFYVILGVSTFYLLSLFC